MLATIKVIRKNPSTVAPTPVYDQETETWTTTAFETILESVPARVQPYGIIGDMVVGQDTSGRRLMRVQIENVATAIHLDDIVIVTASPDNPELTKYTLEVRGAISSSNAWLTDLVCEADLKADT
jgi:hypothetical protein